jgi:hypothetical protein
MSTRIPGAAAAVVIVGATIIIVVAVNQSIKDQPRKEAEHRAANRAYNATVFKSLAQSAHPHADSSFFCQFRVLMITEQCRMAWGEPDHINRTTDARGDHEQWVYPGGNYLNFDNEVLKSIQQTREPDSPQPSPSKATSAAAAPPASAKPFVEPDFVTIVNSVSIKIPYGIVGLQPGTKLRFVARNGENVRVQYMGAEYEIPISATDLK